MPRGLPPNFFPDGSIAGAADLAGGKFLPADFHEQVVQPIRQFLLSLQFASFTEYRSVLIQSYVDLKQAVRSISYLVFITLRPICILGGFILRALLFKANQLALQMIKFQASLDAFTVWMEIAAVLTIALAYLLRRYIQSKRYVPRFQAYVRKKQQAVLKKYMMVIDRIAQTSILLANILPHAFFILIVVALNWTWWGRSLIRFFSVKVPTLQIMMVWIPSIQTILSVARYKRWYNSNNPPKKDAQNDEKASMSNDRRDTFSAASSSNMTSAVQPSLPTSLELQLKELLVYWIVFSVFTAASSFVTFVPFLSSLIFPQHDGTAENFITNIEASVAQSTTILSRISLACSTISSWWKQRGLFLKDLQLLFLLWAWIFSSLAKANNMARGKSSGGATVPSPSKKVKKSLSSTSSWYMMSPLNFLYMRISSICFSRFYQDQDGDTSPIIASLYTNLESFLQLAVLVKLIKPSTKSAIVRVVTQGSHYIPSLVTLVMPGFFTSLGIIYAAYIVASGYSAKLLNSNSKAKLLRSSSSKNVELSAMDPIVHHLQYYSILFLGINTLWTSFFERCVLSTPLLRFILYWVPFQFHIRLLLVLWLQVPLLDGSSVIYRFIEQELVLFGTLKSEYTDICTVDSSSIDRDGKKRRPLIARLFEKLLCLLPTSNDIKSHDEISVCQISESEKEYETPMNDESHASAPTKG
jgi:hypothetical protein